VRVDGFLRSMSTGWIRIRSSWKSGWRVKAVLEAIRFGSCSGSHPKHILVVFQQLEKAGNVPLQLWARVSQCRDIAFRFYSYFIYRIWCSREDQERKHFNYLSYFPLIVTYPVPQSVAWLRPGRLSRLLSRWVFHSTPLKFTAKRNQRWAFH
jgi:hypothetical protein